MHVSLDGSAIQVVEATTLEELLDGLAPQIEPSRLVTHVEVDGATADSTDRAALARWRLGGAEAITIRTEAPRQFAAARRREITGHLARIADLLAAVVDGFTAGDSPGANRGLASAARELRLVLELDRRLVALDGHPSLCSEIAETVRRVGPQLEAAERARRWPEITSLLADEVVPALRAARRDGTDAASDPR